jgi:hypothetical protein
VSEARPPEEPRREREVIVTNGGGGGAGGAVAAVIAVVVLLLVLFFIIGNPFSQSGDGGDTTTVEAPDVEVPDEAEVDVNVNEDEG